MKSNTTTTWGGGGARRMVVQMGHRSKSQRGETSRALVTVLEVTSNFPSTFFLSVAVIVPEHLTSTACFRSTSIVSIY